MKKNIIQYISMIAFVAGLVMPAMAQTTPQDAKIVKEQIERVGDNVSVSFEFLLDDVKVSSNDMIIYTPVLVSANNDNDRLSLSPVVVAGGKRNKILKRQTVLNKENSANVEPEAVLKRKNNSQQSIAYALTVPYSNWMQGATVLVETEVMGCADCNENADDLLVATNILPKKELPVFALTYIEPELEPVKARSDRHTATFNFVVDKYDLLRDYKDNRSKFDEVDAIIREVRGNSDIEITDFNIAGYASPEGGAAHNKMLAENRAKAFADYLVSKFDLDKNLFAVSSHGEDWEGLKKAVEASSLADKAEILDIIATVDNVDARDIPLRKLSGGQTYATLLQQYYPPLRRTEYDIAYVVRSFDVEEAKEIIKTNPKLLSLNEMYLVAHSYGAGTPEFKEVFDIAVRMYPDSDIAIVNSAAADIENGAYDQAISRLQKLSDASKAYNNIGVAYLMKGDYDKAREYFTKASGDKDAKSNLDKLVEFLR